MAARANQDCFWADIGGKTIRTDASFVLAIHLKIKDFVTHGADLGQIDE
jgi:hypothetical protein